MPMKMSASVIANVSAIQLREHFVRRVQIYWADRTRPKSLNLNRHRAILYRHATYLRFSDLGRAQLH